eukprot:2697038-Amphidinium_carterae.1
MVLLRINTTLKIVSQGLHHPPLSISTTDPQVQVRKERQKLKSNAPVHLAGSTIARLRREEEAESTTYPVFMDDVQLGTAYASSHGHVKPSHDKPCQGHQQETSGHSSARYRSSRELDWLEESSRIP